MDIRIQAEAFDQGAELAAFSARQSGVGAVVTFSGLVRDVDGKLERLVIEHYPGMTERAVLGMAGQAMARFGLADVLVIHRFGEMARGEAIMMVATASAHRKAAFEAAEFLMDWLKSRAPFWKKEVTKVGATWVQATCEDEAELVRWADKS